MKNASLKLEKRLAVGGGRVKKLRSNGYVPAVVYGKQAAPRTVMVKATNLREFLIKNGKNAVFNASLESGESFPALVKEIQYGAIRNEFLHVDFQQVSLTENVHVTVPVRIIGREAVEREGGVIAQQLDGVNIECLPQDVPQYIDADISELAVGHSLTAGQLVIPDGVKLLTNPEDVVLSVTSGKHEVQEDKVDEPVVPKGEEGHVEAVEV